MAREIYADNIARIRQCDAMVANLTPWRGLGCDPARRSRADLPPRSAKPVFAYLNVLDEDDADHRGRVDMIMGARQDEQGRWRDGLGNEIEDFGLPENLMLWAEARRFFVIVTPEPFDDLTGLELALDAARVYATA